MAEEGNSEILKSPNYLGVKSELIGSQVGNAEKSGRRKLIQEKNPLTIVRSLNIDGFNGYQQELKNSSTSSNWKEYLLDKKLFSGVLMDNGTLLWFPLSPGLQGKEVVDLAIKMYPDSRPNARFDFGKRGVSESESDLSIVSLEKAEDPYVANMLDYFGRSLNWSKDVDFSVKYADPQKENYRSDFQKHLVGNH